MGKVLVTESYLTAIGDAIRNKSGTTATYTPSQMANAIKNIQSSITYTTGDLKVVSPDAWSLKITQTAHQTIKASLKSILVDNANGTYSPAIDADFSIASDTGYVPGTIQRGADKSTKSYNITANQAEEIAGMIEDGYAKVYEDSRYFYSDEKYTNKLSSLSGAILIAGMKNPNISTIYFSGTPLANNGKLTKFKNTFVTSAGDTFLENCPSLVSVDLPNLTSAGDGFLRDCPSLVSVDLPNLTSVGNGFLRDCDKLKYVYLRSTTMCTLGGSTTLNDSNIHIYVPASLINSYKSASYWSDYANNFKTLESIVLSKLSINGRPEINIYGGNKTEKYSVIYNDGAVHPDQTGVTWSVTGNATISQDGVVTLNNASAGDKLTITATSTYNSSISASMTATVINQSSSMYIDLNNGQWVDTGTTVDGHEVYKSDDGSYNINNGTSVCTVTFQGYSSVTVYIRSYAESNFDYTEVGPLDGTVSRASSSSVVNTKGRQSQTQYYSYKFVIPDGNQHTFQVLYSKDSSGNTYNDRGYFYVVPE